jgi:hypothetical protein
MPTHSLSRTVCGSPCLAVIAFSAKRGLPQTAGYLKRLGTRNPTEHLVFYPLKKPMSVVIGKWDRALV